MKNRLFASLSFLLLFAFISCKKDNDSGTYFRFKLDGAQFEAEGLLAYGVKFSSENTFYGVKSQGGTESCYINVPANVAPGTYDLGAGDYNAYYVNAANEAFSTNWGPSEGSITIESIDGARAKGTFQFTAYDSSTETVKKTITEGEFNVEFR
jgi:hypothetical protein